MFLAPSISEESKRRPINLLTPWTVFWGLVSACRLAICPTSRSPLLVKATMEGVVLAPFWLGMTCAVSAFHHDNAGVFRAEIDSHQLAQCFSSFVSGFVGDPLWNPRRTPSMIPGPLC